MRQKTLDSVFEQINDSYNNLLGLTGLENVEVEEKRVRNELIIAVCGIYFNLHFKYEEITYDAETYSAEIVNKINECISRYRNSSSRQKGITFSKYVCSSIKKMLADLKMKKSFAERSGGQYISKDALTLMNNVKNQDRVFECFGERDENKRNKKIAISLGITEEKVLEMKRLRKLRAVADDDNSFSLTDVVGKDVDYSSSEKKLQKEKIEMILDCIQEEWEQKSDLELSEILTVDILYKFKGKSSEFKPNGSRTHVVYSSALSFDLEEFLSSYSFISKGISSRFFSDPEYELPSQVELAAKFEKTKSGISKQLSRFYEKVAKNEKLKDFEKKVVNF